MAFAFTGDDVVFLLSTAGYAALAAATKRPLRPDTLLTDLTFLRAHAGPHAAAVAETVLLRRKASAQWRDDDWFAAWLLTDTALQQASPPPVAAHRAHRLAAAVTALGRAGVHDVTCSIGADLIALATTGVLAVGSDTDPVRLAMARHNARVADAAVHLLRADATTATTTGLLRYADPARRDAAGRRITGTDTVPPVADLLRADPTVTTVLRLPPAIDYESLGDDGETELVSWRGTVRELVRWPAPLAEARRRATVLGDDGAVIETLCDDDPDTDETTPTRRYVIDPDPAVVRAHLVGHYAARHTLTFLSPHLAYLTGDRPPPHVRSFEVMDEAAYSERTVAAWIRRDSVGTVEIKQRGTSIIPDQLRARLRPRGDRRIAATLIVARIGSGIRAYWCRAQPVPR